MKAPTQQTIQNSKTQLSQNYRKHTSQKALSVFFPRTSRITRSRSDGSDSPTSYAVSPANHVLEFNATTVSVCLWFPSLLSRVKSGPHANRQAHVGVPWRWQAGDVERNDWICLPVGPTRGNYTLMMRERERVCERERERSGFIGTAGAWRASRCVSQIR